MVNLMHFAFYLISRHCNWQLVNRIIVEIQTTSLVDQSKNAQIMSYYR
jgi:hypothetical protein